MQYLQILRPFNLVIVAITQFLVQHLVLVPAFQEAGLSAGLDIWHFSCLVLSTVFIAASGYVINDIVDYEIDQVNKPEKLFIGKYIPVSTAYGYYVTLVGIGFILSFYLAYHISHLALLGLYPLAVALLFAYSKYLKQRVLLGNIIVGLFCAFVAGIVWFAERQAYQQLWKADAEQASYLQFVLSFYLIFAFLSTIFREIIKDVEDMEGDRLYDCRTLPIVYGIRNSKVVAGVFGILLLSCLSIMTVQVYQQEYWIALGFLLLSLLLPNFLVLWQLSVARERKDFKQLSRLAKLMMLSGLLLLFLLA
ncbi:MAG: geranylgeranylglycerol-phosphate geranylgeranyltransferase [Bacteroidota bacterium]